jgi:hypothetical protein
MQSNEESLMELAYRYFSRKNVNLDLNVQVRRDDGKKQKVDIITTNQSGDKTAVLVVNWGRSIGVNVIRKLSRIVNGTPMKKGILIGRTFSEHSRKFAQDYNVQLLSESKLKFDMDEL